MEKSFEDKFSALQADMVSICLEYCERKATHIFVHVIFENDSVFTNFFFRINGKMYKKGKLDDGGTVSPLRQKEALSIITKNVKELIMLCEDTGKPAPTEMKLIYDAQSNSLQSKYGYEPVTTADNTARNITEAWYAENEIGQ